MDRRQDGDMYEPERFKSTEYLAVLDQSGNEYHCSFSDTALDAMKSAAETGYPLEICGLLIGNLENNSWIIEEARQVENLNKERASDRFQLDPNGYQSIDRELRGSGREIIGVFHSHPDCPAKPSPTDLENAWEGFIYPIISVCDGNVSNQLNWALNADGNKFSSVTIQETTSQA
ncbi:MAG: M67 family metallopeptidase [Mariprofundaceae bacterium]